MKFLLPLKGKNTLENFPLLPLRELVLFPHTVIPIFITYKSGITALEDALKGDSRLFAACLKESPVPAAKETASKGGRSRKTAGLG
ncbi:MAG: hypothetical protein LBP74_08980, partial [Treponema sp.]|nr:hypothetical protein [Treponema sp.]